MEQYLKLNYNNNALVITITETTPHKSLSRHAVSFHLHRSTGKLYEKLTENLIYVPTDKNIIRYALELSKFSLQYNIYSSVLGRVIYCLQQPEILTDKEIKELIEAFKQGKENMNNTYLSYDYETGTIDEDTTRPTEYYSRSTGEYHNIVGGSKLAATMLSSMSQCAYDLNDNVGILYDLSIAENAYFICRAGLAEGLRTTAFGNVLHLTQYLLTRRSLPAQLTQETLVNTHTAYAKNSLPTYKRENGEVIAIIDMNVYHLINAFRKELSKEVRSDSMAAKVLYALGNTIDVNAKLAIISETFEDEVEFIDSSVANDLYDEIVKRADELD